VENLLKLDSNHSCAILGMSKSHRVLQQKIVNFMVCYLYLNKVVRKKTESLNFKTERAILSYFLLNVLQICLSYLSEMNFCMWCEVTI
jgi:hypothetical protein